MDSDLRAFLSASAALTPNSGISAYSACASSALGVLSSSPAASRDAVLAFYAVLVDHGLDLHLRSGGGGGAKGEAEDLLDHFRAAVEEFIASNADAWAPVIANWCLGVLGEISGKYAAKVLKSSQQRLHETLPLWLDCHAPRTLIDLTAICLNALVANAEKTENCVSVLLDTSVKHSPHFDWVVAHVGSCFPETVIGRVLSVGLKDFCQSAEAQVWTFAL
jgi:integrator complex subunit 5